MKKINFKTAMFFVLVFFALSIGLPSCSSFAIMAFFFESYGEGYALDFLEALFCIGNWPSMLLGTFPEDDIFGYMHWPAFLSNVIGWTLLGFIIGLIISAMKGRRRKILP